MHEDVRAVQLLSYIRVQLQSRSTSRLIKSTFNGSPGRLALSSFRIRSAPFHWPTQLRLDSAAGTLRESWYTWAGSWYIYSRQQRQVKSRQIDTRSSVYLSLFTNAGFPSIGNLRTAFFSYFSARKLTVVDFHPYTTETLTLLFTYSLFASRVKPKLM